MVTSPPQKELLHKLNGHAIVDLPKQWKSNHSSSRRCYQVVRLICSASDTSDGTSARDSQRRSCLREKPQAGKSSAFQADDVKSRPCRRPKARQPKRSVLDDRTDANDES